MYNYNFLKNINGELYIEDVPATLLAENYGTPLYVFSISEIQRRLDELKNQFVNKYENVRVAYASKAFSCIAMYQLIQRNEFCLDVVSGGELYTANAMNFDMSKIEFNGNNKSYREIEDAIEFGVGRIIVDALDELDIIQKIAMEKNKIVKILYRVTPGVASDSHDYIITGKKDSKFGIPLDQAIIDCHIKKALESKNIEFLGFHFHVGSQLHDNSSHLQALDILLDLVQRTKEKFGFEVKELNLGGGFGIFYTDEKRKDFSYFLDPMMTKIEDFFKKINTKRPSIVIEPGRSIVGEAGLTLYTVGAIKEIPNLREYLSVDGGMTDNIRPALYGAKYKALAVNKLDEKLEKNYRISGKCCESGDIIIDEVNLPVMRRGDILAVLSTGAYGYSMASNYNKNPIPAVVFVSGSLSQKVVQRQTYEQIIQNEAPLDF